MCMTRLMLKQDFHNSSWHALHVAVMSLSQQEHTVSITTPAKLIRKVVVSATATGRNLKSAVSLETGKTTPASASWPYWMPLRKIRWTSYRAWGLFMPSVCSEALKGYSYSCNLCLPASFLSIEKLEVASPGLWSSQSRIRALLCQALVHVNWRHACLWCSSSTRGMYTVQPSHAVLACRIPIRRLWPPGQL